MRVREKKKSNRELIMKCYGIPPHRVPRKIVSFFVPYKTNETILIEYAGHVNVLPSSSSATCPDGLAHRRRVSETHFRPLGRNQGKTGSDF